MRETRASSCRARLSLSLSLSPSTYRARRLEGSRSRAVRGWAKKRASATMTSAIAEPTRLRPRLTTFLRSAFAKSVEDVIDVDEERVRRDETLRGWRGDDASAEPSARLARRVARDERACEDKDVLRECRAFVRVVLKFLGNDAMTEEALGDVAAAAWDATSGLVETLARERRELEEEREYMADYETARKVFDVREREVRKELVESLGRARSDRWRRARRSRESSRRRWRVCCASSLLSRKKAFY